MKLSTSHTYLNLHFLNRNFVTVLLLLFFSTAAYSQLSVAMVNKTDETCPGNGTITLAAQNAQTGTDVYYIVYKLPDTDNPIWNSTNPVVTSLTDGTYSIVVKQGATTSAPIEVIIEDNTQTVAYSITTTDPVCNDGVINITVNSGTAVSYEIISGPVTFPPQTTPSFTDLPAGIYTVRVNDNCGFGVPQAVTLFSMSEELILGETTGLPDAELPDCDLVTVTNSLYTTEFEAASTIQSIVVTVYPPDGSTPIVIQGQYDPMNLITSAVIPLYYEQTYYYDIEVTDSCNTYTQHCEVYVTMLTVVQFDNANCFGKKLLLQPFKFVGPYTITFETYPAGWDPTVANENYPGPYVADDDQIEFGSDEYECPYGIYTGNITDSCGRVAPFTIEIEEIEVVPVASPSQADCSSLLGYVEISIPGLIIATAEVVVAPDEYTEALPDDVMEYYEYSNEPGDEINLLTIPGLPPGQYVVMLTDTCGKEYDPLEFVIEVADPDIPTGQRVDCQEGYATLFVATQKPPISEAYITAAPAAFGETLPYDITPFSTSAATIYMDNLPAGSYTIQVTDDCGVKTKTINLNGYQINSTEVDVTLNCGSFDLYISHNSNAINQVKYWLQQYNEETDAWRIPGGDTDYIEGVEPDDETALELINNETLYNIAHYGTFRVIKSFTTYGSGASKKTCIEILEEFIVPNGLLIDDILNIACDGGATNDVLINATGVEPLTYRIIEMNGEPVMIDNGTGNIFYGLETASYLLQVEDPCGTIVPMNFNVNDLPSLVTANTAPDIILCDAGNDGEEEFNLAAQVAFVLDNQDPDFVTITLHTSENDAEAGINPLPLSDTYTSGNATIYARATHSANPDCVSISQFELILQDAPSLEMDDFYALCEGQSTTVTAPEGYESYEWSTGDTSQSVTFTESGNYTITATNENGCQTTHSFTVTMTAIPRIAQVDITDWTTADNTINVIVELSQYPQEFEYSLDGFIYQDSPLFTNLTPGPYTVYVRDKYDCGADLGDVYLLTYPKFFTPNGDGVNETWRIQYSFFEPDMEIYIFDRYGKLIISFGPNYEGWDGTFHGNRLPSTDYWFLVKRQDGREHKGHFSMVR
ncbi:T9SS type B sorting domain-containing protein [Flavobacterium rakeshii]|uniref:T9SS type B sorting domain-containing protein n=1 Tax=Flavobacterium rakeshii TaxID=1038845 RepID=UPI002E7B03BB|nr:T9SS type B sorting domain-containing protein [Flavobacterium rakeshii]MEE1900197.1 T9SS type B sorting domain-containing protein [Flavobacterium rakeshii]